MNDRVKGCLFGGAVGDALGNPVEFMTMSQIGRKYGPEGIRVLELCNGKAEITDDTQMSILTAESVHERSDERFLSRLWGLYRTWAGYQKGSDAVPEGIFVPGFMRAVRAPGITCLRELDFPLPASPENPRNSSKGCGGIMRSAPVGFGDQDYEEIAYRAVLSAACTHGHPLGYLPAAVLSCAVAREVRGGKGVSDLLHAALDDVRSMADKRLVGVPVVEGKTMFQHFAYMNDLIDSAEVLAGSDRSDLDCFSELGGGWVAEETLAIATFACLRYEDDFAAAVRAAVNHDGDSDSCGAVAGNLLGAHVGFGPICESFDTDSLECSSELEELAGRFRSDIHRLSSNEILHASTVRRYRIQT